MLAEHPTEGWLTEPYDYKRPRRGQVRKGMILNLEERGVTIDVGLKRDGFVPRADIERLGEEASSRLEPGQEVVTRIVRPRDRDGNLILSLYQARLEKDWTKAQEMLESGDVWQGKVTGYNRGGVIVKFGHLRAFVPASHLSALGRLHLSPDQRETKLEACIGQELPLKVIEVNRDRRRLILSERLARQQMREQNKERLLNELVEGQVCRGTVTQLCDFGAFVDLGGADGLIHISELAWRRVRHPREVLQVGDEVEVYVLRLDQERKRIGLSLKRLRPNPWDLVDATYTEGQLVSGIVKNLVDFGAFVTLDTGVDALIHISELADPPPSKPREVVQQGDEIVLRILRINSYRRRIGLSLKRVSAQERDDWLAQQARGQTAETDNVIDSSSDTLSAVHTAEESAPDVTERIVGEEVLEASPPTFVRPPDDERFWISLSKDEEAVKE
jgi:small subunit ribosomal protein S1